MTIFLIDFENVHYEGLSGILNLTEEDEVYIFYSENGKRLTFELHEQINRSRAKFYYYKAAVGGKNALDHQLSTYLGFLVGKTEYKDYCIVSKDRGFRYLVNFWQSANLDLKVVLVDSIKISRSNNGESAEDNGKSVAETKLRRKGQPQKAQAETEDSAPVLEDVEVAAAAKSAEKPKGRTNASRKTAAAKAAATKENVSEPTVVEQGNADKTETALPKIIEFLLPDDILAATNKSIKSAVKLSEAISTVVTENNPLAKPLKAKTASSSKTTAAKNSKTVKAKPAAAKATKSKAAAETVAEKPAGEEVVVETAQEVPTLTTKKFTKRDVAKIFPENKGEGWLDDVTEYVNTAKNKTDLYNMIRRRLGQDQGRVIYNTIKKHI